MIPLFDDRVGSFADRSRSTQFRSVPARIIQHGDKAQSFALRSGVLGLPYLHADAGNARAIDSGAMTEQAVLRDHPDLFPSAAEISGFVMRALGQDSE